MESSEAASTNSEPIPSALDCEIWIPAFAGMNGSYGRPKATTASPWVSWSTLAEPPAAITTYCLPPT